LRKSQPSWQQFSYAARANASLGSAALERNSPTSDIAPPASLENHAGGRSSSLNSMKLREYQQNRVTSS
jgi:hypothetical protein